MDNHYEEISTKSWGKSLKESLQGLMIAPLLIIFSIILLYHNEGRINLSKVAQKAIQISNKEINKNPEIEGKLVSTTGLVQINEKIGGYKFLKQGEYLAIKRTVMMYSWKEIQNSKTTTTLKGEKITKQIYDYKKQWVENPQNSSSFKITNGHINSEKTIPDFTKTTEKALLGIYNIDLSSIILPTFNPLKLNEQNIDLPENSSASQTPNQIKTIIYSTTPIKNTDYIFISNDGQSSIDNPKIGDFRIYYSVLPVNTEYTLMGKLTTEKIVPYYCQDNSTLYRLFKGTKDNAIQVLKQEHKQISWILRLISFIMLWIGFLLFLAPILNLLTIIPIFGTITKTVTALATFLISILLWISFILIFMIFHNIITLIIAISLLITIVVYTFVYYKKKKKVQLEQ
ncbi:MAG: TMEM43 family protein [bacterium]